MSTIGASDARTELWRLINPATGANNVIVDFGTATRFVAGAISFTGANQTDPDGTPVTATGLLTNSPGGSVTGVSTDNIILGVFAAEGAPTITVEGTGQTSRWIGVTNAAPNIRGHGCTEASAVGAVAITHTISASVDWSWIGVEVLVAGGTDVTVAATVGGGSTWQGAAGAAQTGAVVTATVGGGFTMQGVAGAVAIDATPLATAGGGMTFQGQAGIVMDALALFGRAASMFYTATGWRR